MAALNAKPFDHLLKAAPDDAPRCLQLVRLSDISPVTRVNKPVAVQFYVFLLR